jgi:peptide deformylase
MTIRTILPFGDPLLRKRTKPADPAAPNTVKLLDDLVETLYAAEGRAGLAAPQIGILRSVAVMDCGGEHGLLELINPVIVSASGEQIGLEGCLSYPGYVGSVTRAQQVELQYQDRGGTTRQLHASGYLARCVQHELDHLQGVLFIDRMEDGWVTHEQTGHRVRVLDVMRMTNSGI